MHPGDVGRSKAKTREPLALLGEHATESIRGRAIATGRHQLQRHVVEREQHALNAIVAALPRWRAREQRLVGGGARLDIADQNDDVIEPADHGNNPRTVFAARTFSTPIAIAAVRCGIPSAFERATIASKARSRM